MANATFPCRIAPWVPEVFRKAAEGSLPWVLPPRFGWECTITDLDLAGDYATQVSTITIPTLNFASGRLTVTFSGGGLAASVDVTADAAVAEDENDLGDHLETSLNTAIAGDLAGVLASVENDGASNVVNLTFEQGIGIVTITVDFEPAQVSEVTFGGTLLNGAFATTFTGGGLGSPVTVTTTRAAGTPANVAAMAVQHEADIEALIATTLAGVVVSADDDTVDTNSIQFEPGIAAVTVTTSVPPGTTLTFGGTATDGDYATTFTHSSIPAGSATVTTTRAAGTPATNSDLAAQHEADVEADPRLTSLISSADDTGATNAVLGYAGVTGLTFSTSAPAPGTLTSTPPTMAVADATPAGPTVTVSHSLTLDLNSIAEDQGFPSNVIRQWVLINVIEEFGANRTITIGDAGDPNGVLGSTPVTLNTTGRSGSSASDAEYQPRPENAWTPTATIALGSSASVTQGEVLIEILFTPNLENAA